MMASSYSSQHRCVVPTHPLEGRDMKKFWAARPGWKAIVITLVVCMTFIYFAATSFPLWVRLLTGAGFALLVLVQLTTARLHPELYEDANAAIYRGQRDKLFNGLQPLVQAV